MPRNREPSQTRTNLNVKLYCAQCEAQLGIFENEWIRLTSSYARSKEPGTHFATEIGERLQTVPKSAKALAAGCQMAEVFCRKCSNMVGQYCKVVSDTSQRDLHNQYFYKFSRTFLKDGITNSKVDPVFAFCPDLRESSRERSSSVVRHSISSRWQDTPIRQSSSTPMTVQAAARNRIRTQETLEPSILDTEIASRETQDLRDTAESEHDEVQVTAGSSQPRRQSARLVEREGRVFEIEGRLRYHEGRLIDQENFLNDQSARIHEQGIIIEQQRTKIEEQEFRLQDVNDQLETLQRAMNDLRTSVIAPRSQTMSGASHSVTTDDLAGHLDVLAGAFKNASFAMNEIQQLRAENQALKQRLTSGRNSTGPTAGEEVITDTSLVDNLSLQSLGKRKRDGHSDTQVLTPQSDRSNRPFLTEQLGTDDAGISEPTEHTLTAPDQPLMTSLYDKPPQDLRQNLDNTGPLLQGVEPVDAMQIDTDADQPLSNTAPAPPEPVIPLAIPSDQTLSEQGQRTLPDGSTTNFVQDPTAFEDLAFSDEDEDDSTYQIFGIDDDDVGFDEPMNDGTEDHRIPRDSRSTAPEPLLKPKPPANRKRSYITLDRAHIATPYVFWEAIANGKQPKAIKPPAIQTRKKDLEDELRALGLEEWIHKDKKSKEYREAVNAARTKLRAAKKAALLSSKGILPGTVVSAPLPSDPEHGPVLTAIQNVPAMTDANTLYNPQYAPGSENAHVTSKPATANADDPSSAIPLSGPDLPRTRRSTRDPGGNAVVPAHDTEGLSKRSDENEGDQPARRTRSKAQVRSQRKSGPASTVEHAKEVRQHQGQKAARGRPRKSAPAAISDQAEELTSNMAEQLQNAQHEVPATPVNNNEEEASGPSIAVTIPASKQKLLEKMRLKALQKEQMRDQIIMARDKLAEEAMAAMEMEDITA